MNLLYLLDKPEELSDLDLSKRFWLATGLSKINKVRMPTGIDIEWEANAKPVHSLISHCIAYTIHYKYQSPRQTYAACF